MSPSFKLPRRRRNPVHDFLIHRGAQHARIAAVAFERRASTVLRGAARRELFQVQRGDARLHRLAQTIQHIPDDQPGPVHGLQFGG